jgi:hypothetical protein
MRDIDSSQHWHIATCANATDRHGAPYDFACIREEKRCPVFPPTGPVVEPRGG